MFYSLGMIHPIVTYVQQPINICQTQHLL